MTRTTHTEGLDPETDYMEIVRRLSLYEFPWDTLQALSFALFRTYAVPSIGSLLDQTGAFDRDTQKRYDDTAILLEMPLIDGFDSSRGKAALRRINQMHKMYDISNDDFRYVLSTFVVVPHRWIEKYGWRQLSEVESRATVRYHQELGRHMGIKDVPATLAEFEVLMDEYEARHFTYDEGSRRVADCTLDLLVSFYPRLTRPGVRLFSRALMDPPLLEAFGYQDPGWLVRTASESALRLRAKVVALLPPRRRPVYMHEMRRITTYPGGFDVAAMGTFAPGCPVPHGTEHLDHRVG